MPFRLKFAVHQCECGEVFKRGDMLDKHCERWQHSPSEEYTVVVEISRPSNRLNVRVLRGKAENGYS